jgi:dGTPase
MRDFGGFEHNRQSLRVVDLLETRYPDFPGLNLTFETRSGIIRHSTAYDHAPEEDIKSLSESPQPSIETQIVNRADEIAYSCHDIEDGLRSGFFEESDLEELEIWKYITSAVKEFCDWTDRDTFRYQCIRILIDKLIRDLVDQTDENIRGHSLMSPEDAMALEFIVVNFSRKMLAWKKQLDEFLYQKFYTHHKLMRMQYKANRLLTDLFTEYVERPFQLPPGIQKRINEGSESRERIVCDYIAGMTDRFALYEHRKLFLPYEY